MWTELGAIRAGGSMDGSGHSYTNSPLMSPNLGSHWTTWGTHARVPVTGEVVLDQVDLQAGGHSASGSG